MSYDQSPDQTQKDLIDLLTESAQKIIEQEGEDGKIAKVLVTDPETIYWKTQIVNSPNFSRFVFELKNFERLAKEAKNHMSKERAIVLEKQINEISIAYRYSIDAKSFETLRNRHNTQSNLIDKLNRVKIEKSILVNEKDKQSAIESLFNPKKETEN